VIDTKTVAGAEVLVDPHVHGEKLPAQRKACPTLTL